MTNDPPDLDTEVEPPDTAVLCRAAEKGLFLQTDEELREELDPMNDRPEDFLWENY